MKNLRRAAKQHVMGQSWFVYYFYLTSVIKRTISKEGKLKANGISVLLVSVHMMENGVKPWWALDQKMTTLLQS